MEDWHHLTWWIKSRRSHRVMLLLWESVCLSADHRYTRGFFHVPADTLRFLFFYSNEPNWLHRITFVFVIHFQLVPWNHFDNAADRDQRGGSVYSLNIRLRKSPYRGCFYLNAVWCGLDRNETPKWLETRTNA